MRNFSYDEIVIEVDEGVFYPTDTSKLIAEYLALLPKRSMDRILDLGCGSGIVALLMEKYDISAEVCASDITYDAVLNTKRNAAKLNSRIHCRESSLLDNWRGETFDMIINDVSGISESLAPISPWFSGGVSCMTGEEGIDLTLAILDQLPNHLKPGGKFITPLLSLSSYRKALAEMESRFRDVKLISEKEFYLPKEVAKEKDLIESLADKGAIEVEKKFGLYMWKLFLYEATI